MSFALITTQHFERRARKFLRKHPDLRQALRDTLDDLGRDPFQAKLKLHPLSGNPPGVQAVSWPAGRSSASSATSPGPGVLARLQRAEERRLKPYP
jgi:hypothetical protein